MMLDGSIADTSLYNCLELILRLYNKENKIHEILSGIPSENNTLSLKSLIRALERVNIYAAIKKTDLRKLIDLDTPAIALLINNDYLFIKDKDKKSNVINTISLDGTGAESDVLMDDIQQRYLGYAIVIMSGDNEPEVNDTININNSNDWFWKVILKSWRIYRDVLLASFMINVFALASPLFIMNVYDRVVPNHAIETLWVLITGVLIIFSFDLILRVLRGYFIDITGRRADTELSSMLYQHVLGIRMANRPSSIGSFANNLDEFENIRNFITSATVTTLIDLPFVIMFLFVIWYVGGVMVVVPLIAIPLILIYALMLQPLIKRSVNHVMQAASRKNKTLIESLAGIETIKLLGAESRQQHKWEREIDYISKWSVRSRLLSASVVNAATFIQQLTTMSIVAFGVYLISDGRLSLGGLIAGVILTSRVLAPMAQIANLTTHYHRVVTAMQTMTSILNLPVEHNPAVDYLTISDIKGDIEFDSVTFSYPNETSPALENISIKISPGEHVGIIGRTGSGKSTIGKLIAGLYQENSGFIRIDGIDIRQIEPAEVHSNIGYVAQDVTLFSTSIRENILFGCTSATDDQLIRAAELSDVISIIKKHPSGFDMPVGERGLNLSGGQRQSVAIARAVLNDPPIIIMDEPSNSMDHVTESNLRDNLKQYLHGKTFVLITHKASMLELVDRLIVIENGRVIADGNKQQVTNALQSLQKAV